MTVNRINTNKVYCWLKNKLNYLNLCPCCGEPLVSQQAICNSCQSLLRPLDGPLCRCALPTAEDNDGQLCGRCIKRPPAYQSCRSAYVYAFPLDRLVNHYKHHGRLSIEPLLVGIWRQSLAAQNRLEADALVPIPLHWWRYGQRGFNQSARLAQRLSAQLEMPVLHALSQPKRSRLLQGQGARARRQRARQRFQLRQPVDGLHLLLLDDVITTGSTAHEAARLLLKAGASRVDLMTLCRVLPPSLNHQSTPVFHTDHLSA